MSEQDSNLVQELESLERDVATLSVIRPSATPSPLGLFFLLIGVLCLFFLPDLALLALGFSTVFLFTYFLQPFKIEQFSLLLLFTILLVLSFSQLVYPELFFYLAIVLSILFFFAASFLFFFGLLLERTFRHFWTIGYFFIFVLLSISFYLLYAHWLALFSLYLFLGLSSSLFFQEVKEIKKKKNWLQDRMKKK